MNVRKSAELFTEGQRTRSASSWHSLQAWPRYTNNKDNMYAQPCGVKTDRILQQGAALGSLWSTNDLHSWVCRYKLIDCSAL